MIADLSFVLFFTHWINVASLSVFHFPRCFLHVVAMSVHLCINSISLQKVSPRHMVKWMISLKRWIGHHNTHTLIQHIHAIAMIGCWQSADPANQCHLTQETGIHQPITDCTNHHQHWILWIHLPWLWNAANGDSFFPSFWTYPSQGHFHLQRNKKESREAYFRTGQSQVGWILGTIRHWLVRMDYLFMSWWIIDL